MCAVKSIARLRRTESVVSLERGVCSCADLQAFSCYRCWKETWYATHDFSNIETWDVINFYFLQSKAPREIQSILTEIWMKTSLTYASVKKWAALFIRGDFIICVSLRPERNKTGTTPGIVNQIQKLIFEDAGFRLNQYLSK